MYNSNRGNNRFDGERDFNRQGFRKRGSSEREMHKTTCSKCGNDCEVPFRPTGERPVYCSKCFEGMRSSDSRGNNNTEGQFKKQFESLNWKLDKILKILNPAISPEAVQEGKIKKEVKVMKPKESSI